MQMFLQHKSVMICGKSIYGVWRRGCGQVNEMGEGVCLALSVQRGGGEGLVVVVSAWQGVCWRPYKNWRLQAWPRLFPTRSTFFSTGMRHRHLLQAETYNLGLSGPLSNRINWCAGPFSAVPTGRGIPAHAFLRHIPVPRGVSLVFYGSSAWWWGGGLGYSCSSALSWLKTKIAAWPSDLEDIPDRPWISKCQNVDQQRMAVLKRTDLGFSCWLQSVWR